MAERARRLGAVAAAGLLAASVGAPALAANDEARTEFAWADERITESSGLAFVGDLLVTTNDSGDGPVLYVVDPATGETVGTTTYATAPGLEPVDVEALAPVPGERAVWVGDIGDNRSARDSVAVHRVPIAAGDRSVPAQSVELVYSDGPHDAETLLSDPRTGRLYVVTKSLTGAGVYAAPRDLDRFARTADGAADGRVATLRPVGRVPGFLTDGLLLPRRAGVLLRDYAGSTAYTWPGLERITPVGIPPMRQGEAIALRGGRVWASTEGEATDVVSVPLPPVLVARTSSDGESATGEPPEPDVGPGDGPVDAPAAADPPYATDPSVIPPWVITVAVPVVGAAVVGLAAIALARRRMRGGS